jgi:hypothetical protein
MAEEYSEEKDRLAGGYNLERTYLLVETNRCTLN